MLSCLGFCSPNAIAVISECQSLRKVVSNIGNVIRRSLVRAQIYHFFEQNPNIFSDNILDQNTVMSLCWKWIMDKDADESWKNINVFLHTILASGIVMHKGTRAGNKTATTMASLELHPFLIGRGHKSFGPHILGSTLEILKMPARMRAFLWLHSGVRVDKNKYVPFDDTQEAHQKRLIKLVSSDTMASWNLGQYCESYGQTVAEMTENNRLNSSSAQRLKTKTLSKIRRGRSSVDLTRDVKLVEGALIALKLIRKKNLLLPPVSLSTSSSMLLQPDNGPDIARDFNGVAFVNSLMAIQQQGLQLATADATCLIEGTTRKGSLSIPMTQKEIEKVMLAAEKRRLALAKRRLSAVAKEPVRNNHDIIPKYTLIYVSNNIYFLLWLSDKT